MNKRLTLLAAACLFSANAFAADGFTGFYIGAHAGHGKGDSDNSVALGGAWASESAALQAEVVDGFSQSLNPSGSTFGVQLGYDHQFASGFLLGGEFDYSKLNVEDTDSTGLQPTTTFPSLSYNFTNRIEADDSLSLRLKAGYTNGSHLVFVTAGIGQVDVDASAGMVSNGGYNKLGTTSKSLDTTVWGVGYEYLFADNWSFRFDYLNTDADDFRYDTVYQPGSSFVTPAYTETVRQEFDYDTFRVGVNYRF